MNCCKPIVASLFLAFVHGAAAAASPVLDAAQAGMGGTAAAASLENAAMTTNPSLIGLHRRYDFSGHARFGYDAATEWGVSAVDGRTSNWITMGLLYRGYKAHPTLTTSDLPGWSIPGATPSNIKRRHDVILALAGHVFQDRLAFGLSGTVLFYDHDRQGQGSTGNMDAGLSAHATRFLVLGVAGRNLLPVEGSGDLPMSGVAGFRLYGDPGTIRADLEWQDLNQDPWYSSGKNASPWTGAVGLERRFGNVTALRGGYRWSGPDGNMHRVTTGLGLMGPEGSIEFGAMIPVGPNEPTLRSTAVLMTINLQAPDMDQVPF